MPTTEHTINDAVAQVLRTTRHTWRHSKIVLSENTGTLKGGSGQPDILVVEPNVSPVAIETEVLPAVTVEAETISRLGQQLRRTGDTILSSVAVRLPTRLREMHGSALSDELASAKDFELALYTGSDPSTSSRWPRSGWIAGGISGLSLLVQSASVPPNVIDAAADELVNGVSDAAGLLENMATANPSAIHNISVELRQEDGAQTRRMAATILANAFVFQETLAGGPGELAHVSSLEQLRGTTGNLTKSVVLKEWRKILQVNYWPIFDIARRILEMVPAANSRPLIERLATTADRLLQNNLMRSHDLTGAVFQRLIADRKFLAAYYTTPAAAALLAGLAISADRPPAGRSWQLADDVKTLRIADFACGTGTLLSTAYQHIGQLHELAGGDAASLHPQMMATALVGCDVLPAAAHLTASMLAGAHPTVKYAHSSILTVAYGKQPDGTIALGSLDLLDPQGKLSIVAVTAKAAGGMGQDERDTWESLPHKSFDVVIMNPPFTRATGQEGKKIGVPNPMFAAFSSSEEEQRLMAKATERLTKGTSAHGNAGEASIFLVLANRKLVDGGMLALVMPLSLMTGESWQKSRDLLSKNYADLVLVSISGANGGELSFSADTDMGECLVIGRKVETGSTRATFVVLDERPAYPLVAANVAEQIRRLAVRRKMRRLEDGPVGGTPLTFGDDVIGQAMDAPLSASGGWNPCRIRDLSLAQTAYQLAHEKRIWLPTMNQPEAFSIPMATVAAIGSMGPYHADINGRTQKGIRGPFDVSKVKPNSSPTYPVLWAHDAPTQRAMVFPPDSEGTPRRGKTKQEQATIDGKVASVWKTASHCHFNRDFRFNSQSTGMQFTFRKSIGGRAWLSISLPTVEEEKTLTLWGNTSLGLLLHWWHANKEQSGRGSVGLLSLEQLPTLDVTALKPAQLAKASALFDTISGRDLLAMHEIDKDAVRAELDVAFARDVLRVPEPILAPGGPLELLRMKLAQEPSIRGQKK